LVAADVPEELHRRLKLGGLEPFAVLTVTGKHQASGRKRGQKVFACGKKIKDALFYFQAADEKYHRWAQGQRLRLK
jgi:hypothetical protein